MTDRNEQSPEQAGISRRDTLKLAAAIAAFGVAMGVRPAASIAQGKTEGKTEGKTDGKTIAQPLASSGIFPQLMIDLVKIGEDTGDVPSALMRVTRCTTSARSLSSCPGSAPS